MKWQCWERWVPLGLIVGMLCIATTRGEPRTTPFVAGFERFARHQEIVKIPAGRLLLSELSCTACHSTKETSLQPKRGPRLSGAGNRLRPEWVTRFLASPQTTKPGTTMPEMFAGWPKAERGRAIQAIAAFLGSRREAFPVIKASGLHPVPFEFWNKGNPESGKQLYHQVGCVACHAADADYETVKIKPSPLDQLLELLDPQELAEMGLAARARRVESIPHGDLPAKYTRQSLTFFLLDPEKTRPAGRMPSLKLQPARAADIAAYLLRVQTPTAQPETPSYSESLIQAGRRLFVELKCITCHEVSGLKDVPTAKPLADLKASSKRTCYGTAKRGLPHFSLDHTQTAAIETALDASSKSTKIPAADRLSFRLLQLNCYACHERGNRGGVGRYRKPYFETVRHVDIGDEGRLPPPLTGVGRKLQSAWLSKVLKGTGDARPHMQIRMPQFPASAVETLPGLFVEVDHPNQQPSETEVFGNLSGLADAGRMLLDNGCVQCHPLRGESLPGVVGVDLEGIAGRVQPEWFHDFLLDPGNLKPRTRMPTFFPKGKSQNPNVLAGDTERQIAAMWAYLKELDKQPLPEKIERVRSQDFELKPAGRPIVLRTFMKEAGTHAITVGFPQKVHFAFDAETARPAVAWRGRFLDAQGTWFSRFTPPAEPLGDDFISLPAGMPFAFLKDHKEPWPKVDSLNPSYRYLGYRLDAAGVPTFLYRFGPFDIEDRIAPEGETNLKRQFTIKNRKPNQEPPPLWFRANVGKALNSEASQSFANDAGLTVVVGKLKNQGELRQSGSLGEWIIPLAVQTEQTIEVQYQW